MTPAEMVREFHEAFGVEIRDAPGIPDNATECLRYDLIDEESAEALDALCGDDVAAIARELADLVYVTYGAALAYGIDLDRVIAEVHRANMSKLGADGKPVFRSDGKVLKSENFSPADVAGVLGIEAP